MDASSRRRRKTTYNLELEAVEARVLQSVAPLLALRQLKTAAQLAHPSSSTSTATPTPYQQRRMAFNAHYLGKFAQGPGLYTDQKFQIYIKAQGTSNQYLHGAVQLAYAVPLDSSTSATGTANLTDKNIAQTGTQLSMDLTATPGAVDAHGRPTAFNWTLNGSSGGNYTSATGQGTVQIRYFPSGGHLHQGFVGSAAVIFTGQVTTVGTFNILR